MSATVYVFRHMRDLRRGETRNVGVALATDDQIAAVFLGEGEPGEIDGRRVRFQVSDTATYQDWVLYWRHHLDRGADGLSDLLDPRMQKPDFTLQEAGEILLDQDETPRFTVEQLYAELVETGAPAEASAARHVVGLAEELIHAAGVDRRAGFKRRIPVRDRRMSTVEYRFPFGIQNGHTTVAGAVALDNHARLEQLLFRFEHVPATTGKICLIRRAGPDDGRLELVSEVADAVVDLEADDAVERVAEVFAI